MIPLIGREGCPKCRGTGVAFSAGVPNADRSAYTFTASQCDCVKITLTGVPQTFTVSAKDVERGQRPGVSIGYRTEDWKSVV